MQEQIEDLDSAISATTTERRNETMLVLNSEEDEGGTHSPVL
jgi:hypothetical protein